MAAALTTTQVQKAATELSRMRRALTQWLRYRTLNDQILAGTARVRRPLPYAQRVVAASRDRQVEQDLATKLYAILTVTMPGYPLPGPDVFSNPEAAVQLAKLAIAGASPAPGPAATGGIFTGSHPWLWPVLIVGAVLLTVTTAISTAADVAKDREQKACIEAGACTDYGFWLKVGGIAVVAWLAWEKMGLGRSLTKKGRP